MTDMSQVRKALIKAAAKTKQIEFARIVSAQLSQDEADLFLALDTEEVVRVELSALPELITREAPLIEEPEESPGTTKSQAAPGKTKATKAKKGKKPASRQEADTKRFH